MPIRRSTLPSVVVGWLAVGWLAVGWLAVGWLAVGCAADVGAHREPVVNGRPAADGELYGTVAIPMGGIVVDVDAQPTCTGTLIRSNVVLSAAHCFFAHDVNERPTNTLAPLDQLEVVAGARSLVEATAGQRYRVTDVRIHPSYDHVRFWNTGGDIGPVWSDIALVVTDRPVTQVDVVPLLASSELERLGAGVEVMVAGYGATRLDGGEALGFGTLTVAELYVEAVSATELAASSATGADTCSGDSGGPAYLFVEGAPLVVGVTSRGAPSLEALCGGGGLYTMPHAFEAWIVEEVGPAESAGGGCSVAREPRGRSVLAAGLVAALAAFARRRYAALA